MCEATQKFRKIVAKAFITKSLKELERTNLTSVDVLYSLTYYKFVEVLRDMFESFVNSDFGAKYKQEGRNLFENEYERAILTEVPAYRTRQEKLHGSASLDLNELFINETDRSKFFDIIKKPYLTKKQQTDPENGAMMQFQETLRDKMHVANPNFVMYHQNVLFLSQQRVSEEHGLGLLQYMETTKDVGQKRLHKIVLESCGMRDKTFSMILDGAIMQNEIHPRNGKVNT